MSVTFSDGQPADLPRREADWWAAFAAEFCTTRRRRRLYGVFAMRERGMTFAAIAGVLTVSEGRAKRIHDEALAEIRDHWESGRAACSCNADGLLAIGPQRRRRA